ncbi:MAG TPA: hypothetical protein VGG33_29720 [Polyangia bacterium]
MPSLALRFSWRKSADLLRYAAFAGMFGIGVAACDQEEGERCEIDSDCASGLRCELTAGNGICRPINSSNTNPDGAAPDAMTSRPDTAVDMREAGGEVRIDSAADVPDAAADVPVQVDTPADTGVDVSAPDVSSDTSDGRVDQAG